MNRFGAGTIFLILLAGCLHRGTALFGSSSHKAADWGRRRDLVLSIQRGGAGRRRPSEYDDNHDDSDYDEDENHREQKKYVSRRRRRPPPPKKKPLWQKVASQSAKLSGKALSATAQVSSKAAYHLVTPKHVEWRELVGLWRLDEWMNDEARPFQSSIELSIRKMVLFKNTRQKRTIQLPVRFRPSKWPLSARLEFQNPETELIYIATIHRKLADKSVIKLRGKIYAKKRWGGSKVLVGTFMGRKRLKLLDDEEEEDAEQEDDEEYVDLDKLDEESSKDSKRARENKEQDDDDGDEEDEEDYYDFSDEDE